MRWREGDRFKYKHDKSTYGHIDTVKGWLFKKYWCFYWGEDKDGRVTDPSYWTYARWFKASEMVSPTQSKSTKQERRVDDVVEN